MSIPSKSEFDPLGCLDAQAAWRHFGGLTIDQAFEKFLENPLLYQEDFMFMGGAAFAYYFPVIDRYLRESRIGGNEVEEEVEEVGILAHCIKLQWEGPRERSVEVLRTPVLDLVAYVRRNASQYCTDKNEQLRIASAWRELEETVRSTGEPA